jgi:ribonuclease P protein component
LDAGRADRSLPRAYRLVSSEDFHRVYQRSRRGRLGPFAWFARHNACGHPRLGLAVPKKVMKKATDRSRVKRLIRESFRYNRDKLPSADIVVSVKAAPRDLYDPAFGRLVDRVWEDMMSRFLKAP